MIKTTIMVNKREKIYYIISISDKRLSYLFISLILTLSFYSFLLFSLFFVLILSYLSGTYTFFLPTYLGGTFYPLLDIFERNFFPRWGVHVHTPPPCVRAWSTIHVLCIWIAASPSSKISRTGNQTTQLVFFT